MAGGTKISFIGFGEAAQAFATGFSAESAPMEMVAFDIKTTGPDADAKHDDYKRLGVAGALSCAEACSDRDIIFSMVTAEQAEQAGIESSGAHLGDALFLDCNSCAPDTKRRVAGRVDRAGGRYVDVAIMTPVHPKLHRAPCLLAGPHARAAADICRSLGMNAEISGPRIGDASTRKMIRSTMIKGLEALTLECFLAARKAGIEDDILASLEASFPGFDWQRRAPYMMERVATHGIRRAAEMEEVAKTLTDLGIAPNMTRGTIDCQRRIGALGIDLTRTDDRDLAARADALLEGLLPKSPDTNSEE